MNHFVAVDNTVDPVALKAARGRIRLGLCCINSTLRKQNIYVNRTCTRKYYTPERALELALLNCRDILKILEWNEAHNIRHYRLSSDMFPHYTDNETAKYTPTEEIIDALRAAGEYARAKGHRITMHPGQYNVVGTPNKNVFEKTCEDLAMHAWILDTMGMSQEDSVLCVHLGGVYGDKDATLRRWIDQFEELPESVQSRLAVENCEKSYSVEDCLYVAHACSIPHIYDSHHYYCYKHLHPNAEVMEIEELMPEVIQTWTAFHRTPLFHVSDQAEGKVVGAHHDYIDQLPSHMLSVPYLFNCNLDIEVEAKAKEEAIFCLYKRHPEVFS